MALKTIPIQEPIIDSLSLLIPLNQVEILNKRLTSETLTYYADIDELEEELSSPKPIVIEDIENGITTRYRISKMMNGKTQEQVEYLTITLSSKLLKGRYFEGITLDNLKELHKSFMRMRVVKFDLVQMAHAKVLDVDIAINYRILTDNFIKSNKLVEQKLLAGKGKFFNHIIKKDKQGNVLNTGIEFSTRAKATPSTPYLKNYFKGIELQTKSKIFYEKHLKKNYPISDIENLARIEYTIKNAKHQKRLIKLKILKKQYHSLLDLLELHRDNSNSLFKIIQSGFTDYMVKREKIKINMETKDLSPIDKVLLHYMAELISFGYDEEKLLSVIQEFETGSVAKSRTKKKLSSLIKHLKDNSLSISAQIKDNTEIQGFFRMIDENQNLDIKKNERKEENLNS